VDRPVTGAFTGGLIDGEWGWYWRVEICRIEPGSSGGLIERVAQVQ